MTQADIDDLKRWMKGVVDRAWKKHVNDNSDESFNLKTCLPLNSDSDKFK